MVEFAQLFTEHMDAKGVKYTVKSENVVNVTYNGDNKDEISIYVVFDKDGDGLVELKCWDVEKFKNKKDSALKVCNDLNLKYRWVKFYVDDDDDVIVSMDAIIDRSTCGAECLSLVLRLVNILDDAYPEIAKARWA
ncbi:MAG: YbjN domain-containing protein [Clostridia bacterium]|nr:YbjN domain-containing protein [Clostridia bacterium]